MSVLLRVFNSLKDGLRFQVQRIATIVGEKCSMASTVRVCVRVYACTVVPAPRRVRG